MTQFVYGFAEGNKDQKALLGGKGANLAEMTNLGLPVPPGFTITTEACRSYLAAGSEPSELRVQVTMAMRKLEYELGRDLGDRHDPLLVSVRSGAMHSMPGMMETVLNIGLNDESVKGLADVSGNARFAWDSYRRLLQMFGKTVLGIDGEVFSEALDHAKQAKGCGNRCRAPGGRSRGFGRHVQEPHPRAHGRGVSSAAARTARPGRPGGVRFLEHRPRAPLPAARAHPPRPRHRGQHLHDGVRQPRRGQRHRRRVHPRSCFRPEGRLR